MSLIVKFYSILIILKTFKNVLPQVKVPFISKEVHHLMLMDNDISKLLNSTKKEDGDILLRSLNKYFQTFDEFDRNVQRNSSHYADSAFHLMKLGSPLFINSSYNVYQLAIQFQWQEVQSKTFLTSMRKIKKLSIFFPLHCQSLVYTSFEEMLKL